MTPANPGEKGAHCREVELRLFDRGHVRALLEDDELGFGQIISLMGVGDMPHYRTVKSMELFATQVIPALRGRSTEAREAAPA